ncbi:hypothetical protein [Embleya hyalina]|uniref:Plasmid stabilization protein n=1 Tax=Embleya hyalina TaxID=516124 RepID=A0A401YF43_9ACTN|nr:hypothetical protein [Embleya hyalina]GCD93236.1 hypothetical protein EHYA_00879 [Embleya hyalina]
MAYLVQYASTAEAELTKLSAARQREVRSGIDRSIGRDPYGCGSAPVRGNRDRREVSVAGAVLRYEVSSGVLIVTVLRLVAPFG